MNEEAATNNLLGSTSPSTDSPLAQALAEFRVMLRYALAEGLDLDDKTRKAIAAVPSAPESKDLEAVIAAHVELSKIIAPATPLSIEATEPGKGTLGSLRRPPLVMWMIIIAIVAAFAFVLTGILSTSSKGSPVLEKLNWLSAASLGAVFYVLFTAHSYVTNRTFDPRYNTVYLVRFVLGVLSGLILAIVLGTPLFNGNSTVKQLGPAVIALLGGFSTEAVYQILQRLVDVLLAAVRGDQSEAAKAKASQAAQKELLTMADDPAMPQDLKSKALTAVKKIAA